MTGDTKRDRVAAILAMMRAQEPLSAPTNDEDIEYRFVVPKTRCEKRISRRKIYTVGSDGSFWSKANGEPWRLLKPHCDSRGYLRVRAQGLRLNSSTRLLHNIVLEAFGGKRPEGMECCHKDDDRSNNRIENLYWGTSKENMEDAARNGKILKGEDRYNAKLSNQQVREIFELWKSGIKPKKLSIRFQCSKFTISSIISGRRWNSVTGIPKKIRE